jgi:hypothetical protein
MILIGGMMRIPRLTEVCCPDRKDIVSGRAENSAMHRTAP